MVIQGLQKLTLLDYPEKVACTVFTAGCNFRCPFCHNASLVIDTYKNKEIPSEEFFDFLKKRQGILDGVARSPEKQEKYIRTIYNKANDMARLIDELNFYSKIETNRIPYNYSKLCVREYFDDCAEEIGLDMEGKGISFTYENQVEDSVMVIADPEQLRRVINNIVGNSVKYLDKSPGKLCIRVLDVGDFIQCDIEDNGRGIAKQDLTRIFERFYRTDASRNSSQGGSGIGLSIVKKIIEDHGGRIWASSQEGEGTTIHFLLRKYIEVKAD